MTLTVLSDHQVSSILETLSPSDLDSFRRVLDSALHHLSSAGASGPHPEAFQQPHRVTTTHPATQATTLYMPSCGPEGMGCKVVSLTTPSATTNPATNPPIHPISPTGVLSLFAPSGPLLGLIHASHLTAFRTALASTNLLTRRPHHPLTLVVFGTGLQAYWHVRLALMLRGPAIRRVTFINHRRRPPTSSPIIRAFFSNDDVISADVRRREGWHALDFSLLVPDGEGGGGGDAEFGRLRAERLGEADVVYCCTPSSVHLFDDCELGGGDGDGDGKGRLIVAVGSFRPDMRELPEALLRRVTKGRGVVVVDTLQGVLSEAGEIISAGIPASHLVELGKLVMLPDELPTKESETETLESCSGSKENKADDGAQAEEEQDDKDRLIRWLRHGTVVYKSVGLGLMDLVVGMHLLKLANEKNIGTRIEGF